MCATLRPRRETSRVSFWPSWFSVTVGAPVQKLTRKSFFCQQLSVRSAVTFLLGQCLHGTYIKKKQAVDAMTRVRSFNYRRGLILFIECPRPDMIDTWKIKVNLCYYLLNAFIGLDSSAALKFCNHSRLLSMVRIYFIKMQYFIVDNRNVIYDYQWRCQDEILGVESKA